MLEKKVVLVTGASRGIGHAILSKFANDNFVVVGTATSAKGLAEIDRVLEGTNTDGMSVQLDLSSVESINALVETLKSSKLGVDILINNAGITDDNLALRMKIDQWSKVIDSNLTGTFLLCQKFLRPMLKKRHGRIINISSVVAAMGNPGQCNYSAAKAGLEAMSKSLAKEIAGRGITVNSIAPGFVETDMTAAMEDGVREQMIASIPVGYMGQPEDIAAAVLFLASDSARYITGHTLQVNGGIYM